MFKEMFTEAAPREYKRFNAKDFKKGDKVIVTIRTVSGHLDEERPAIVKKVHANGLEVQHTWSEYLGKAPKNTVFYPEIGVDDIRKSINEFSLSSLFKSPDEKYKKGIKDPNKFLDAKTGDPVWFGWNGTLVKGYLLKFLPNKKALIDVSDRFETIVGSHFRNIILSIEDLASKDIYYGNVSKKLVFESAISSKEFKTLMEEVKREIKTQNNWDSLAYEVGRNLVLSVPGLNEYLRIRNVKSNKIDEYIGDAILSA
jgi:hypothetical protein